MTRPGLRGAVQAHGLPGRFEPSRHCTKPHAPLTQTEGFSSFYLNWPPQLCISAFPFICFYCFLFVCLIYREHMINKPQHPLSDTLPPPPPLHVSLGLSFLIWAVNKGFGRNDSTFHLSTNLYFGPARSPTWGHGWEGTEEALVAPTVDHFSLSLREKQMVYLRENKGQTGGKLNAGRSFKLCCSKVIVNGSAVLTLPSDNGPPRGWSGSLSHFPVDFHMCPSLVTHLLPYLEWQLLFQQAQREFPRYRHHGWMGRDWHG